METQVSTIDTLLKQLEALPPEAKTFLAPQTEAELKDILVQAQVFVESQGWDQQKLTELFHELSTGEKRLFTFKSQDSDNQLVGCEFDLASIDVRHTTSEGKEFVLKEKWQHTTDIHENIRSEANGKLYNISMKRRSRDLPRSVSEKFKQDKDKPEGSQAAAERAMKEELGLVAGEFQLRSVKTQQEVTLSTGYPNIFNFSQVSIFEAQVTDKVFAKGGFTEVETIPHEKGMFMGVKLTKRVWVPIEDTQTPKP